MGHDAQFESLKDVKALYKQNIKTNKVLTNMTRCLDENDDMKVIENSFFKIFCYNEFVKDTYQTNKVKHFELILKMHGFNISEEGEAKGLDKGIKDEMKTLVEEYNDELFDEYLKAVDKTLIKFDIINKHVELLGLDKHDNTTIEKYKEIITNKHSTQDHLNIIRLLKSDEFIDSKLKLVIDNGFDVKTIKSTYNKIKLLRTIETTYDIKPLEVNYEKKGDISMTDNVFALFKTLFKSTKSKPTNYNDLKKLYIGIIKSITCNDIINSKQTTKKTDGTNNKLSTQVVLKGDGSKNKGTEREYQYTLNTELIQFHLELNKNNNKNGRGFKTEFVDMFIIDVKQMVTNEIEFVEDMF